MEMFLPMIKQVIPQLAKAPVAEQSAALVDATKWLTEWFRTKKLATELRVGEDELVLMFREVNGHLLMIPVVMGTNLQGHEMVTRALVDQGINVTAMVPMIPAYSMLPMVLEQENAPNQKLKLEQEFITILRKAARIPHARLAEAAPAPVPAPAPRPMPPMPPYVPPVAQPDTVNDTDSVPGDDFEWEVQEFEAQDGTITVQVEPREAWILLTDEEQDDILADAGHDRSQLVTDEAE
jgi:hypothetical protein